MLLVTLAVASSCPTRVAFAVPAVAAEVAPFAGMDVAQPLLLVPMVWMDQPVGADVPVPIPSKFSEYDPVNET